MKILVIGSNHSMSAQRMLEALKEQYPVAEITHVASIEDMPKTQEVTGIWCDESSSFDSIDSLRYALCPSEPLPCREKVMHPWSRRKKR